MAVDVNETGAAVDARIEMRLQLALPAVAIDVDLVTSASRIAVVGASGAGKSTLLRVIAGLERQAEGHVRIGSTTLMDTAAGLALDPWDRALGWVPQDALLFPHLTVRQNLAYAGMGEERVDQVADLLRIGDLLDRGPRRLSGGERQRVALGRALLSARTALLLDEPVSALDRDLRAEVSGQVRSYCEERDLPMVLVSHDEEDVSALVEERWLMQGGRLARI